MGLSGCRALHPSTAAHNKLQPMGADGHSTRHMGRWWDRAGADRGDGAGAGPQDRAFRAAREPSCRHRFRGDTRRDRHGACIGGAQPPPAGRHGAPPDDRGGLLGQGSGCRASCGDLHQGQCGRQCPLHFPRHDACGRVSLSYPEGGPRMSDTPTALDLPMADPLPEQTRKYFDVCEDKLGMVPNVLRAYAFDIEKLNAFTAMYNDLMLADSGLSKLEREMIAVAVSSIYRCWYCQVAHGAAVRALSGTPELGEAMVMNWRMANLDSRQTAMLTFAAKVTKASAETTESDRQALRDAGFSARDIWDIANVVGFFNMTNRVASATGMQPNAEYHAQAR